MGKWAARLAENSAAPSFEGTDKTAKRGLLSVLAVTPEGGAREFEAAQMVDALDLSAVAWTDGDIARFLDRRARLLRWGWAEPEAEKLADRLARRDRDRDERVSCTDCRHYRPGRCGNHRRAGLNVAEVGRDLAAMLQRCAGFDQGTTA
ncbi:MAG: hypothetical protein Q7U99_15315 [Rubrivivax sp.]|nr:hypothetical protein [Rubrivivax sp.]